MLTIGADQAASLLASNAASYGEMQKQTYLQNKNKLTQLTGILLATVAVIIAIVITWASFVATTGFAATFLTHVLATVAATMAIVSSALQLAIVHPGIPTICDKLHKEH